ncbi:POK9 protein, partial [Hemiprocne comata]|nr:POK9 protein [Hemiprocne comata]
RARSAIAQYGLHSQLTQQIIRFIFTTDLLIPADSLQVANVGYLDTIPSATARSAGVDLETALDTTLQDTVVHLVDSNAQGPLGHNLSALLLGRSSTSRLGIFVLPEVIDADYEGTIKIMVYTLTPPVFIPKGSRIAQLVPFKPCVPQLGIAERGHGGFGSTRSPQVYLSMEIAKAKPECEIIMIARNGQRTQTKMLIDTGADVTIISESQWPRTWPTVLAPSGIFGIGGSQSTRVS